MNGPARAAGHELFMKTGLVLKPGRPFRLRRKYVYLLGTCLLVAVGIARWPGSNSPLEHALDRLLTAPLTIWRAPPETFDNFSDRESAACMAVVLRSGTNCVPYLCGELRRRETAFNRFCVARWRTLPTFLNRILPEPVSVRARRLRALTLLQCLGHGAVRPATGTLIGILSDPTPEIAAQAASALGLVLPESLRAREAFVAYFQRTRGGEFLGAEMWSAEFWKDVPELLPQLVRQLETPYLAGDAARALNVYGTNAAPAVTALLEAAADGFAGGFEKLEKAGREPPRYDLLMETRCNALLALAKTGVRNDRVLETFFQAWNEASFPMLRYNGGSVIAACGEVAAPLVPRMVATLEDEDVFALVRKINALGELGPVARAALPKLRAYESGELPGSSSPELKDAAVEDIQFAATVAICRIAPAEAGARLDRLAAEFGNREQVAQCLGSLKDLAPRILPLLRSRLLEQDRLIAARAAFVILRLDPGDPQARSRLIAECESRDLLRRLFAARLLLDATGDVAHTLPVFVELLQRPETRFEAEQGILACGLAARPAAPELRKLLWHPRGEIRRAAGDILRAIAPESLPPINQRVL
ncbi:MAG: hypothetical protein DME19_06760 [Verrucomicrobia bacterium]|nr:MAG: hypothetical protein DME19_06760 [Verrucomicrobiota bacterium]